MRTCLVTNIQGYSIHDGPGIRTVLFLKGCSLACQWCSNPECISPRSELGFFRSLCTKCGKCAGACPDEALAGEKGQTPIIRREKCSACGKCASVCQYKALVTYGRAMSVEEVFDAVRRDVIFYQASGGGLTVSGGEPLLQPDFVGDLFELCHQTGIQTCIETSGCASEAALGRVLPHTDLVLYDLKHMDSAIHLRLAGHSNASILENAGKVVASGVATLFRMPLIPGINDDTQNIGATADFLSRLGKRFARIELMPYHAFGKGKYESLDRAYPLAKMTGTGHDYVERIKRDFENSGITCTISG